MRHAGSLLLSLFLAPFIWVLTGYGLYEVNRSRAQFLDGFEVEILLGLLALAAAGGLYALLTMARLSPVGPALVGLIFFGLAAWSAFDPSSYFDTMPTDLRDGDLALTYPALGYSAMLAVPLIATLLSPRRWRRYAHPAAATPVAAPPPYPMPAAGMPPGAVPPGGAYAPPYGGPPTFGATPGYLAPPPPPGAPYPGAPGQPQPQYQPPPQQPAPTSAFPAAPPAPTSAPPVPSSAPPAPAPEPATQRIPTSVPPAPEPATQRIPTSLPPAPAPEPATQRIPTQTPPPAVEQETTTRLGQPPADGQTTRIPSSPTTGDQTTTRIGAQDTEATQLLKGPPPKDAYPRPAWSAPTPPPITARKPADDLDDPEATQPAS